MTAKVGIKKIEFHDANEASYLYPSQGYSLPAGRSATTVTFAVGLGGENYIEMTVVVGRQFASYDELVNEAYKRLAERLEQFGKTAEALKMAEEESQKKKVAGQPPV